MAHLAGRLAPANTLNAGEEPSLKLPSNVAERPGHTIVVQRALGIVYVVGDVGKPSGFLMW